VKVLVVSGIWPPDVGGPATHAPEVASLLHGHGHAVEVVTTADREPEPMLYPVRWADRALPAPLRHTAVARLVAARARQADVVYTTGMFTRSALGAFAARTPYVVKLTGDPAFERARWRGVVAADLESFAHSPGGPQVRALRAVRDAVLRRAAHVFCPSAYLRQLVLGWGVAPDRVEVLPNPAPRVEAIADRDTLRGRLGFDGPTVVFAGRLTAQKALDTALESLARVPGVDLVVAGDGPEEGRLRDRAAALGLDGRARFVGAQPRERVLELFRAADASLLPSAWENFPHTLVEALAAGTPVVATDVGGVAEVVRDEENGLLVRAGDSAALTAALERVRDEPALLAGLRDRAAASVEAYAPDRLLARVEAALTAARR
jgi:glycosyltransferase involved in cell wall biosynthesis